jgi:hypothetical protein|nr:MAG TPA: hypothetical protein [Caudoviricetes sp.]
MQLDGTKFKIFLKNIFKFLPRRMMKNKKEKKKEHLTKNKKVE